jgi:type VI secretion system protein VasD
MNRRPTQRALAAAALLALAAGCAAGPAGGAAPAPLRLTVTAAARLNPDEYGNSLPTAVRVYQLKSAARTGAADLAALLREPKEVLGEDLLGMDEVFVEPKGSAEKTIAREKDARAVMVVAVVRRPSGDGWRLVYELPSSGKTTALDVTVDEYRIVGR